MDIEQRAKHHMAFYRLISGWQHAGCAVGHEKRNLYFDQFGNCLVIHQRTR